MTCKGAWFLRINASKALITIGYQDIADWLLSEARDLNLCEMVYCLSNKTWLSYSVLLRADALTISRGIPHFFSTLRSIELRKD
jgi:hypothetical protein